MKGVFFGGTKIVIYVYYLGGGFNFFLFSPRTLGKIPILTNIVFKGVETTN